MITRYKPPISRQRRPVPGDLVFHRRHGVGQVRSNWGTITSNRGRESADCTNIFDVIFTTKHGGKYLHCCRQEYLTIL